MVIANDGDCFKCGLPGHWAAHCPLNYPAATRAEHEARIARIVERWDRGFGITTHQKMTLIKQENELWNNREKTGARK